MLSLFFLSSVPVLHSYLGKNYEPLLCLYVFQVYMFSFKMRTSKQKILCIHRLLHPTSFMASDLKVTQKPIKLRLYSFHRSMSPNAYDLAGFFISENNQTGLFYSQFLLRWNQWFWLGFKI